MLAGAEKVAEKIPGWVERLLIPSIETRVRTIVKEELGHLEKTMNAKFEGMEARFQAIDIRFDAVAARFDWVDAELDAVNTRMDSLEKRMNLVGDIADIKARLTVIEKQTAG